MEATLDHNTGIDAATTEAAHDDVTQPTEDTVTHYTVTHCTGHMTDHPYITTPCVMNAEITVGYTHEHPTDLQT